MRVLKIVSSIFPNYPMFVKPDADSISRGLEQILGEDIEIDDDITVEITITPQQMPLEEFEALEPWEP